MISPPLPPLPPSGPPYSMNFSRRNETAPGPPAPERMKILAWSRKCIVIDLKSASCRRKPASRSARRGASHPDPGIHRVTTLFVKGAPLPVFARFRQPREREQLDGGDGARGVAGQAELGGHRRTH